MSDPLAVIVVCARPESRRIPHKVFYKIAGRTALEHVLRRCLLTGFPVVLAVPDEHRGLFWDNLWRTFGSSVKLYSGQGDSPLHRVPEAASLFYPEAKYIVRVTCDDPLVDAETITNLVQACSTSSATYGSTPDIMRGCGVEVVLAAHWKKIASETETRTEMSTYFIKHNLTNKQVLFLKPREAIRRPYRLELDYPEDGILLNILLRTLGPDATSDQVASYLDNHSYLLSINRLPQLSFYTCVYNGERYIDRTVMSIFNCGFPVKEYVIVDNASTDKTVAHLGAYACAPGVKLIFNSENVGLASAANIAVQECRGKWVMRVDADDILLPDMLGPFLEFAERMDADIAYSRYNEIDSQGAFNIQGDQKGNHHAGCALMRRSFLEKLRFKEGINLGDSKELYERARRLGKIAYYEPTTWLYRRHAGSLTAMKILNG